MDFQLTEEQTLIQDMAKNFAATELAPYSSKWDAEKFSRPRGFYQGRRAWIYGHVFV